MIDGDRQAESGGWAVASAGVAVGALPREDSGMSLCHVRRMMMVACMTLALEEALAMERISLLAIQEYSR